MSQDLQTYDFSVGGRSEPISLLISALCEQARLAHESANTTTKPFKLSLPSNDVPFFTVEHYGVGLTQENLRSIYLNHNDDGITSYLQQAHACFNYSCNFFVRTRLNGLKTEASFHKDVFDGNVEIVSIPSTIDNGGMNMFSVTVPVKSCDIDTFLVCALHELGRYNIEVYMDGSPFSFPEKATAPVNHVDVLML